MQTNVEVGEDNSISGTLKYVTGYTGFSSDAELQEGNYIALKVNAAPELTITVALKNGLSGAVTLDADRNVVIRVADISTQNEITVTASAEDYETKVITFDISGLTLEESGG